MTFDANDAKAIIPLVGVSVVYVVKNAFDMYSTFSDARDRKIIRDNIIRQTGSLERIEQLQLSDTQAIKTGVKVQEITVQKIDRIDKGVIQLKAIAGIPDTNI